MPTGVVKFYNATKGYGFIVSDEGGDVFVHASDLQNSNLMALQDGQRVGFEVLTNERTGRTKAVKVRLL